MQNRQEETLNDEIQEEICKQMQTGFKWSSEAWSIQQIVDAWKDGKGILIDPDYQRGNVWDNYKNKALIETIFKHGGNKIPTLTFRSVDDSKFEIMDGKQRILSAIIPFVNDEFKLNGVYTKALQDLNLSEIKKRYPMVYSAFMGTTIPVQIASNMNDDEAVTYFIQINNSGVTMRIGEQIHAMQGTPLMKTINELRNHDVWDYVHRISRFNDHAYISRMLMHCIDSGDNGDLITIYSNKQLLNRISHYYSFPLPESAVKSVKKTLDVLNKIFKQNGQCIFLTEFYSVFVYVNLYIDKLNVKQFGEFICKLYDFIHKGEKGVFTLIKQQSNVQGYGLDKSQYYYWYINTINKLYSKYLKGATWDEIKELSVAE